MARRLKEFRRRNRSVYPWQQWLDGGPYRAVHGQDFECAVRSFRGYLYVKAARSGLSVETTEHPGGIVDFQFSHGG